MEVLTPFIADGLRRGDRCFCVQKPEVLKRLVYDLIFLGLDPDKEMARGALDLHTEQETYFPNQRFEPNEVMNLLVRSISDARAMGFTAFRSAGELSWATEGRNDCDKVLGYEKLVDDYYPGQPAIGLCQYDMNKFAPEVLRDVVQAHRLQLAETAANSQHSSIHFRNPEWSAEVVADRLAENPRYYYVVQSRQPRKIASWGVAPDFESAAAMISQVAQDGEASVSRSCKP